MSGGIRTGAVAGAASSPTGETGRALVGPGLVAALAAMALTTLVAATARAAGVELEIPDEGEEVPLSGIAFMTGFFSAVGLVLALALRRWSARPAAWFVRTTVALTAVSLVPPFLVDAAAATAATLAGLHLVAAVVVVPALARRLSGRR
ncbi:DUF6069 family protein [Nocardioides sp. 503]|uniref:DUF6069 family protein n=1 Tax=Nocardioides sp. 503 TaxID=2508326 RepID=UPI001ADD1A32|nr:DUF6069 family protein [Nocardioides sp. 503]